MSFSVMVLAHRVPYPPNKGEKLRTFHQLKHLAGAGAAVHVLAPLADEADEANLSALRDELGVAVDGARNRFRRLRLATGLLTAQPLSARNFHFRRLQRLVDRRLSEQAFDAIVCTGSGMARYVLESKFLSGPIGTKPLLVMDFMDLDSAKWRQYAEMHGFPISLIYGREAYLLARYERLVHERFDECVFVAEREAALFASSLPERSDHVHVIGNGVDTDAFYPADDYPGSREVRCVFVGVMDYFPNEDAMTWFVGEIWPSLRAHWPDARLSIVGMNPSAAVADLASVPGVDVIGYVDDILPWLQGATVFVAPLRIARGVQNKIIQAFSAGVPVVTTSAGSEGLDCSPGEGFLVADASEDFVARVRDIVERPELAETLRRNALERVHGRYSWRAQNESLDRLVRRGDERTPGSN